MIFFAATLLTIAILAPIAAGYLWHAGRPQQPSNIVSLADAKARREQAQRIADADPKSIHEGGF